MKVTLLNLAISIILISCNNLDKPNEVDYTGYIEKSFYLTGRDKVEELNDTLALLQIKMPERLDTFYRWNHYSCCSSCGWLKYRFADKKYPQLAESGWYWTIIPDSVYQLNIWHRPQWEVPDSITYRPLNLKDTNFYFSHPRNLFSFAGNFVFIKKEFRTINNRNFIIIAFLSPHGYLTNSETLYLGAITHLKDRDLYFAAECGTQDTTGFIDNLYKSFLSIRIKENP